MRYVIQPIILVTLFAISGCEYLTFDVSSTGSDVVQIINASDRDLHVETLKRDALSTELLPSDLTRSDLDGPVLAPGTDARFELGALSPQDTLALVLYAAHPDSSTPHLSRVMPVSATELDQGSFELTIQDEDLETDYLFGDMYRIARESDVGPGVHPPQLVDQQLEAWVSYGGCIESTFALAYQVGDQGTTLRLIRETMADELPCESLMVHELRFELTQELLDQDRIILLNPNEGADPVEDAFDLSP